MEASPIQFKLPSRPEYCDLVRLATAGIARKANFSEEIVEDIKTAVAEACLNVIRHAYDGKADEMALYFTLKADELEIVVEDKGKGFDVENTIKKAVKMDTASPRYSGFGLLIMKSIMDVVEITSQKNAGCRVRLVKHHSPKHNA